MKSALELIAEERQRQIEQEGYSTEHDQQHTDGQLAIAASVYAFPPTTTYPVYGVRSEGWPFGHSEFKETRDDRIRELTKAGALIVAEIDRLMAAPSAEKEE